MRHDDDVILGVRNEYGREWNPFSLSFADRRQHLYVIGKSGTGKTTLLRNLILQDIEAGRGVAVIDPHGDLALDILDHIPSRRCEDVAYFDPSDAENPVGLNLVAHVPPEKRHLVASGIVEAFKGIWSSSWGPRLEYVLHAAIAAVLDCENVSLLAVQRMLSDARYRAWIVKQVKDPVVRGFWENEFERYEPRFLQEVIAPIQNKIGRVLMSPHLRNILGQVKSRIDARFMMDRGRIFIANLSKGKLGAESANLLGALLVAQFQTAAMSRAEVPEAERRPFLLYVDEFQSFTSDSFATALSEVRKYGLGLVLSHQFTAQLRPGILDAVFGNVGSLIAFRVGQADAKTLEVIYGEGHAAPHLTSLSNGEVFARLLRDGRDAPPFIGRTYPPFGTRYGRSEKIIRRSRERYSTKRGIVGRKIERWLS